jgi:hypothetical protein
MFVISKHLLNCPEKVLPARTTVRSGKYRDNFVSRIRQLAEKAKQITPIDRVSSINCLGDSSMQTTG